MQKNNVILGDCLDVMRDMDDNSIDFCVSDLPYGISFMGKKWDYDLPSVAVFEELNRILTPGAHALLFGGTRTYHRLVCNVEDAGFDIRDSIAWHYSCGFPKNLNIAKEIDKKNGCKKEISDDKPITAHAKRYAGLGTALKPATELICLARKKISENTITDNVMRHGTGALNIKEARIGNERMTKMEVIKRGNCFSTPGNPIKSIAHKKEGAGEIGRWPANVVFDENTINGKEYARYFYVSKPSKAEKNKYCENINKRITSDGRKKSIDNPRLRAKSLRNNFHPTIKPIDLIKHLIRIVSRQGQLGIDMFAGSGTFAVACRDTLRDYICIERDTDYIEIINARLRQGSLFC